MATPLRTSTYGHQPAYEHDEQVDGYHADQQQQGDHLADGSYADQSEVQEPQVDAWRLILQTVLDMGPVLDLASELADISAAEKAVVVKDQERLAELDGLRDEVSNLERDLKQAQQAAERPANQPTTIQHKTEVEHIEQLYTQTAKQLKEEEAAVAKKELELSRWKAEREEVAKMTVGDEDGWADGKVIRLKLFTEAGFTLVPGKENATSKVLVRNDAKPDIHTVSLDKSRSKAYNANVIWGLASD